AAPLILLFHLLLLSRKSIGAIGRDTEPGDSAALNSPPSPGVRASERAGLMKKKARLLTKTLPQFFLLRFGFFLQTPDVDGQLLLERFNFLVIPCSLRFRDLVLQEQFPLSNSRLET